MDQNKGYSLLKGLGILLLTIFGIWIIYSLLFGMGFGMNASFGGRNGGGQMYMNYGYGLTGTITLLLLFLIKVLFVLFIVGLVAGIAIAIRKYVFTLEDLESIKSTFTGQKTVIIKEACSICGKELEQNWKVCPYCGKETNT